MPTAPAALVLDLLEWLAAGPRPYAEAMEAWRTSCPRLTIWEDAVDEGLVVRRHCAGQAPVVELTSVGVERLRRARGRTVEDRDPGRLVRHP
jgi:hypothetical protein